MLCWVGWVLARRVVGVAIALTVGSEPLSCHKQPNA